MLWLDQAKLLSDGKKSRIQCCKSDRSMIISNSNSGYGAYCFRCGFNEFEPHGERSISHILRGRAEIEFKRSRSIHLPFDAIPICVNTCSEESQAWILKAGISLNVAADQYGILYSPKMDRVILPVYDDNGGLHYMQARALHGQEPKYINTSNPTENVLFWAEDWRKDDQVVITEDILSAIKVGPVNVACSILGTNMTAERAYKITLEYDKILLWFDNYEAGDRCRKTSRKQLELQGIEFIRDIRTEKDPKCYSHKEIQELIDQCLNS